MNSTNLNLRSALVALLCSIALAGCGGGSGGTGNVASGGTGGTGISFGPVTGFGSVVVNGVHFNFDPASVSLDDDGSAGGSTGGLQIGMVVRVHGEINEDGASGTAVDIEYEDNLKGPIATIDPANGGNPRTATVLGQTVIMDSATYFYGFTDNSLTGPSAGQVIEVSGLVDDNGAIHATYIEMKSATPTYPLSVEVKGKIKAGSLTLNSFMINDLTISYDGTTELKDLPGGVLAEGLYVEAKGTISSGSATTMAAESNGEIEGESEGIDVSDSPKAEVEGYVTDSSATEFKIGSLVVNISGVTYENCSVTPVNNGTKVEAEGALVGGVLQASKVECD